MSIDPTEIRMPGAVPLSVPPATAGQGGQRGQGGGYVLDVTEATFQADVMDRSHTVPVVIDFWAEWCGPCKQLSPVLERLAAEGGGQWLLAKVDVDSNQRLAQAFGVQGIPAVKAVVGGQLVDLFTGAVPEPQVRQVLDQLRTIAAQLGVVGRADPVAPGAGAAGQDGEAGEAGGPEAEPLPPYALEAQEALDRGDVAGAVAAFERAIADNPGDDQARQGLAQVRFIERLQLLTDPDEVRREAADRPDDIDAQLRVADLDVYAGHVEDAFTRLVDIVRGTADDDRDRVRKHLLELFDVVGGDDPSVLRARRALTSALF
ncbi:MAG: tetratricopeptide repeat protein [Frankiaceae bacterium]